MIMDSLVLSLPISRIKVLLEILLYPQFPPLTQLFLPTIPLLLIIPHPQTILISPLLGLMLFLKDLSGLLMFLEFPFGGLLLDLLPVSVLQDMPLILITTFTTTPSGNQILVPLPPFSPGLIPSSTSQPPPVLEVPIRKSGIS